MTNDKSVKISNINRKALWIHLMVYFVSSLLVFATNLMISPSYLWSGWVFIGWGFAVLAHAIVTFGEEQKPN